MTWTQARQHFPNSWLVFEVLKGRHEENRWLVDELAVIESGEAAVSLQRHCTDLRRRYPGREFGFYHTANEAICIEVRERYR